VFKQILLRVVVGVALIVAGCGSSEPDSKSAESSATSPDSTSLKEIQQQRSGDYVVALLNETGELKQGANVLTLEFRKTSDNELTDVGDVKVESTMTMQTGPMLASTKVTPSGTAGRYSINADLSMAGAWKTVVTFGGNQRVEFDLVAK
jgi:hypothetical protein